MDNGTKVAVKCARYHVEDDRDGHNMRLIAREIHAWTKCHHDNVLELLGLTQHRGKLAVVSPWMENGNLRQYLGRNPDADRVELCLQITRGLAYLHEHDMVHGDLKGVSDPLSAARLVAVTNDTPQANVLISDAGVPKLADFGNTKLKEQTMQITTRTSTPYSLRWAAPEILENSPCSMAADVYALGMTIYETTTGDVPYADKTDRAVLVDIIVHRRTPSWDARLARLTSEKGQLWRLMTECWSHDSQRRPPAREVEAQLELISRTPSTSGEIKDASSELNHSHQLDYMRSQQGPGDQDSRVKAGPHTPIDGSKLEPPLSPNLVKHSEMRRKLVIVGSAPCGKTCLLLVFAKGIFQKADIPTIFDNYVADVEVDGISIELGLKWDLSVPPTLEYDRLRPLSYPGSHIVLMCFSVDSRDSFENIEAKWVSEVNHFCSGLPFILVGCKKDLRHDPATTEELRLSGQSPVTTEEGIELAQKISARRYLECSAKTGEGVCEVFQCAVLATLASFQARKTQEAQKRQKRPQT
ncbi:GTP-binding protein Rho1 [Ceratobasidium sp. 392]|nr:GTP-binding protein Rho1 [Ceratobasidium sp. 392]